MIAHPLTAVPPQTYLYIVSGEDYLSCADAGYADLKAEYQCRDAVDL